MMLLSQLVVAVADALRDKALEAHLAAAAAWLLLLVRRRRRSRQPVDQMVLRHRLALLLGEAAHALGTRRHLLLLRASAVLDHVRELCEESLRAQDLLSARLGLCRAFRQLADHRLAAAAACRLRDDPAGAAAAEDAALRNLLQARRFLL